MAKPVHEYDDFVHVGPGSLAGRYMRTFWQPVAASRNVPVGKARRVKILGEFITLYRGASGELHAVDDRCPHRSTQLSAGWVEGDSIRCFYHGWVFDGRGRCSEQPAEKNENFASKVSIRAFPARDYLGLVFVYLGEGEPPEFQRYPEMEDENAGVLYANVEKTPIPCGFFQRVENAVDQAHLPFVHRDVYSSVGMAEVPECEFSETSYGIEARGERDAAGQRKTHFHMPNINYLRIPPGRNETGWQLYLGWRTPLDDVSYINIDLRRIQVAPETRRRIEADPDFARDWKPFPNDIVLAVGYARRILDGEMEMADIEPKDPRLLIAVQDNIAQMGQGEVVDRSVERLGVSDKGIILLRKLWREELKALAEGRPLRQWRRPPEGLNATTGAPPELATA